MHEHDQIRPAAADRRYFERMNEPPPARPRALDLEQPARVTITLADGSGSPHRGVARRTADRIADRTAHEPIPYRLTGMALMVLTIERMERSR